MGVMALVILAIWFLVGVAGGLGTAWLVRRVWKERSRLSLAVKVAAALTVSAALLATFGVVFGVLTALGPMGRESIDPSQKARMLAEGISEAMNCCALGTLVWTPSMIAAVVLLRRGQQPTRQRC